MYLFKNFVLDSHLSALICLMANEFLQHVLYVYYSNMQCFFLHDYDISNFDILLDLYVQY